MNKKLKIGVLGPVALPLESLDLENPTNSRYGGVELVVTELMRGYSDLGHDAYLFAPADSNISSGTLIPTLDSHTWKTVNGHRRTGTPKEELERHYSLALDWVKQNSVDVLHNHLFLTSSDAYQELKSNIDVPIVTTIHGPVNFSALERYERDAHNLKQGFPVSYYGISKEHQRTIERDSNLSLADYVYNGIPMELYQYESNPGSYLFWIGRIDEKKGLDRAIHIAKEANMPLLVAGEVHDSQLSHFKKDVEPYITEWNPEEKRFMNSAVHYRDSAALDAYISTVLQDIESGKTYSPGDVVFLGPVNTLQKEVLYRNAKATLMPNRWEEPFGLVLAESYATGTPVYGTNKGSLKELIVPGVTGAIVADDNESEFIKNTAQLINSQQINREDVYSFAKENFSRDAMSNKYINIFNSSLR